MHSNRRAAKRLIALVSVLAIGLAACGGDGGGGGGTTTQKAGGTFRIEFDEFPWSVSGNGFDPSFEYLTLNWALLKHLLVRGLMGYNHRAADKGGANVLPDMATGPGEYTEDHKQITYKLKPNIKFGPPVNRVITSKDFAYSLQRVAIDALDSGGYANYFEEIIEGMQDFSDKKADTVSGITTPDDSTLVIKFTTPVYDMDYRMAMPATSPIPAEVADCFKKPLEYGQYVVSSGPYMIEGMDALDASSCASIKKPSGFNFDQKMSLVRNPNYDPATDSKEQREALPDRYEMTLNTNASDIFNKAERNQVDWAAASVPPEVLQKYTGNATLSPLLHSRNVDNANWYITMNMTEPPFDDVHVRKASNLILDKAALLQVIGGELKGKPAEHIIPPGLLGGELAPGEFDPYATPNHAGDVELAKAEMKQSKYDTNKDGTCDAAVCSKVVHVTRQTDPFPAMAPIIESSFAKIGIKLETKEVASYYGEAGAPAKRTHVGSGGGWGPDWPEPFTFMQIPFSGRAIGEAGNINTALVGITKEKAAELKANYPADGVPSVDADIDACAAKQGDERKTCWIDLDKKIMNEIVPWIPYRWSEANFVVSAAATGWDFDIFSNEPSLAHMGIDPAKQV